MSRRLSRTLALLAALVAAAVVPAPSVLANAAPVIEPMDPKFAHETDLLTFSLYAADADGDLVSWSAAGLPAGATLTDFGHHSARFDWTPALGAAGSYSVDFTATDALGADDTVTLGITIDPAPTHPYFTVLPDVDLVDSQTTTTDIRARDAQGDPITLSVTGLPSWASFLDLGNGHGRITWQTPVGQLGWAASLGATASGTGSEFIAFNARVVGWVELELHVPGDGFAYASPGDVVTLPVVVHNHGNTGATMSFRNSLFYVWANLTPAPVFVPGGGSVTVDVIVTVPPTGHMNWVHLIAEADGIFGQFDFVTWQVRVPLSIEPTITQAGPILPARGNVRLTYLDGTPAIGLPITVTESWAFHPLDLLENRAYLVSNATGESTFGFAFIGTTGLPLTHDLQFDVNRYGHHDILDMEYAVLVSYP